MLWFISWDTPSTHVRVEIESYKSCSTENAPLFALKRYGRNKEENNMASKSSSPIPLLREKGQII